MIPMRLLLSTVLALAACMLHARAQIEATIASHFLVPGEEVLLSVAIDGTAPIPPQVPATPGISINRLSMRPREEFVPGHRAIRTIYDYSVTCRDTGDYAIPSIVTTSRGTLLKTDPIALTVISPSSIEWQDITFGNVRVQCAAAILTRNMKPYLGEAMEAEIKVFVPKGLNVIDWGIPEVGRDGVTAWRFEPSHIKSYPFLGSRAYISVSYPSTAATTRTGKCTLGPGRVRITARQLMLDGAPVATTNHGFLDLPALTLDSQPLPPGAPEGFENTVGDYTITATSSAQEVNEGDPVPVDIIVTGKGNLDAVSVPKPTNADAWKLYDTTAQERGDERRKLSGSVVFHQFMRPVAPTDRIPAFKLVYFNPATAKYETATTQSIPVRFIAAPASAKAAATSADGITKAARVPVEHMTDILSIIAAPAPRHGSSGFFRPWMIHLVGALAALAILAKHVFARLAAKRRKSPQAIERNRDLKAVEATPANDSKALLMAAGSFIERWFSETKNPDLQAILDQRDSTCFAPDAAPQLDSSRRKSILQTLRRASASAALILISATLLWPSQAQAQDAFTDAKIAYQEAHFHDAAAKWLDSAPYEQLSADTLYNIGNACYRMSLPGEAALYYRRALARQPGHPEAAQNLRFIERKYGSITYNRPTYQSALARIPLSVWQNTTWACAWLALIALVTYLTRPGGHRLHVVAATLLVAASITATCTAFGCYYFPEDSHFAPYARQAVVTAEEAAVHTDASRTSAEVIKAPPGSLCEIIRTTGDWSYIAFTNETRGWVLSTAITPLIPGTAPAPPKPPKKTANTTST